MQVVVSTQQIQVLLFETFWNFFSSNIFDPLLVESVDAEPEDIESQLCVCMLCVCVCVCVSYWFCVSGEH